MPLDGQNYVPLTETKADPFSLESLVAWLETQDPAREYDYWDTTDCLICKYGRGVGLGVDCAGADLFFIGGNLFTFPTFDMRAITEVEPWTMGAALDRARTLLAARAGI